ncbi:hypothetical protein [Actinoplanes regularis]|uniref:hypothetical protein n=1 Tax=Actinoplanes regularis TaxID=52697 RepID=UPI0024A0AC07|nr:hypothetical protein [Actinoplanes regularis]GLW35010.1 hypothetical protein Areg01_79460 [Actinoplanes regularis]
MRARATGATITLLAVLTGGCTDLGTGGTLPAPARSGPTAPVVRDRWESCDATGVASQDQFGEAQDALTLPLLGGDGSGDGFQPVAAVICGVAPRKGPAGGREIVAEEARADDLTVLLPALRLPDEAAAFEVNCTLELPAVPWLVLLDSEGRWIRPGIPTDVCGKPRTEFREAFPKLTTTTVRSRVIRQLDSGEPAQGGCYPTWADRTWARGGVENVRESTVPPLPEDVAVRRCVYEVPTGKRGSAEPAGDFRFGGLLAADDWTAIRAEIEASAPGTGTCATPASSFAVFHLEAGAHVYVEADGCRRILIEPANGAGVYRQGSARLTSLVFD